MMATAVDGEDKASIITQIMMLLDEASIREFEEPQPDFQLPVEVEEIVDIEGQPVCFIYLMSDIVCDILRVKHGSRFWRDISSEPTEDWTFEIVTEDGVRYGQDLTPSQLAKTLERLKMFLEIR